MLPRLAADYRAIVNDLGDEAAKRDMHRARIELRRLLGDEIPLRVSADGTYLEAAVPAVPERLVAMAVGNGANATAQRMGVAGGCNRTRLHVDGNARQGVSRRAARSSETLP